MDKAKLIKDLEIMRDCSEAQPPENKDVIQDTINYINGDYMDESKEEWLKERVLESLKINADNMLYAPSDKLDGLRKCEIDFIKTKLKINIIIGQVK